MKFVIVTGMSGSGKSTAVDVLEDIGYFLELSIYLRESLLHLGDRLRCSDTSYYVLTLRRRRQRRRPFP